MDPHHATTFDHVRRIASPPDQQAPDVNVREWHSFRVTGVIVRVGSNPVSTIESESSFVSSVLKYLLYSKGKTSR